MWWWTIQSLAVSAVLAAAVWIVCRIGRLGPVSRHALWLVVLIKLLTPPLVAWPWAVPNPLDVPHPIQQTAQTAIAESSLPVPPKIDSGTHSAEIVIIEPVVAAPFELPMNNDSSPIAQPLPNNIAPAAIQ